MNRAAAGMSLSIALLSSLIAAGCEEKKAADSSAAGGAATQASGAAGGALKLVSFSYDPTREFYKAFNPQFAAHWKQQHGQDVAVETVHGPSGQQAQSIIAGNVADVAALSVDIDVDKIAEAGLLEMNWRDKFPNGSTPYSSAVVFLVRKGNPKNIKDWADLARDDVVGLAPDPKTGGGARWIYLAAWAHALREGGDEAAAREFTTKVYDNAVLAPAQRGSTTQFIQGGEGDVLFGWENEILQIVNDPSAKGQYEIVLPSDSIVIEVPIAVVTEVAKKRGTLALAEAYVNFLYSPAGQELVAKFYNRPFSTEVAERHKGQFPPLTLYRFKEYFKDWPTVTKQHFANGGELDKIRGK